MGGDHKCPVCGSTFTRSQHVARHMRSHTGDRPYKCVHCGDQFARSDLLSRHVNKCHSTEKKVVPAQNNNRRKPRQLSTSPATQQPGQPFAQSSYGQSLQMDAHAHADPFSSVYQQSPRRNSVAHSVEAGDPPSLSSSSLASNSSASASVDSLPHSATEPVFHLPQQHYIPQSSMGRQWGSNQYPYMQSFDANAPVNGVHQYNDLPTPLAYPGAPFRPNSSDQAGSLDPFIPNHYSSIQALNGVPLDSTAYMPSLHQSQASATTRPTNGITRADGTFSSAFGLMSLDDPNVLAGISADGIPFFEHAMAGSNGMTDLHSMLSQNGYLLSDSNNLPTPNTRERENNALRDLWSSFLRDPTTGLKADGTEMGRPDFPSPAHPQMHRRSSSYGGSGSKPGGQPPPPHSNSNPSANEFKPGPHPQALPGAGNVIQRLEDQALKLEAVAIPASTVLSGGGETLKSYEEAILSRKAPVLKMPMKTKASGGSSILPPLSQSGRTTTVGGGVGSLHALQQQPLPTAAGVSGVPVGSTPNSALQQHLQGAFGPGERPVIAMPKPRSRRPSNATGPPSRPGSSSAGPIMPTGPGSNHSSQPNSRPGTASSNGGYPNQGPSVHSSPPPITHAHSQPNSRPGTAAGMSPSYNNFAYAPPPLQYSMSPTGTAYNYQPGSLPTDSAVSPTGHQVMSALSSASIIDNSNSISARPTYKRLASQTLEPASAKRPHFRRGDTNFNPTNEEGFDSEGTSDAERSVTSERSYSGHEHSYASAGPNGPGYGRAWSGTMMSGYTNGARRMSEPAVAAVRMAMRMPAGAKP